MKIAYLSRIAYSDVDLSFLQEASRYADYTYFVMLTPYDRTSCAMDLKHIVLQPGLNKATDIPSFQKFSKLFDLTKLYLFFSPALHDYEWNSVKYARKICNLLKKERYDIVHLTFVPSITSTLYLRNFKNKLVLTLHDPIPHSTTTYNMEKHNRKFAFRFFKNYILLNKAQEQDFLSTYKLSAKKVTIYKSELSAYNYLHIYDTDKKPSSKPYILFFGNITAYKGLEYLFEAMTMVHDKEQDLTLVVAGKGSYYFDIEKYKKLSYFDIRNHFINDDELACLVAGSKFVIIPYTEATQSGVVMTAYAFNKPCIATNVGGLPEMVVDGKYGLVVPPRDSRALSDAIVKLLREESLTKLFSHNINKDYQEGEKSWSRIAKDMISIYENVLKK